MNLFVLYIKQYLLIIYLTDLYTPSLNNAMHYYDTKATAYSITSTLYVPVRKS